MPTIDEHECKYKHNMDFISSIEGKGFEDWQITGCFYAALHIIQAKLHLIKNVPDEQMGSHEDTKEIIKQNFKDVCADYTSLLSLSYTSRYKAAGELLSNSLEDAKKHLQSVVDECESYDRDYRRTKK